MSVTHMLQNTGCGAGPEIGRHEVEKRVWVQIIVCYVNATPEDL